MGRTEYDILISELEEIQNTFNKEFLALKKQGDKLADIEGIPGVDVSVKMTEVVTDLMSIKNTATSLSVLIVSLNRDKMNKATIPK